MNKEEVLAAVTQNGLALIFASKELINDREVVLTAVNQDGCSLSYASNELKTDKEILYIAKNYITENKEDYLKEYELLMRYEREDELRENLDDKNRVIKIKKKV